jgi:hypothetical protein
MKARRIAAPDPTRDLPDPAKVAARGYKRWRVFDYDAGTETEWPIVEVIREGKKVFAWGEPIRCGWKPEQ